MLVSYSSFVLTIRFIKACLVLVVLVVTCFFWDLSPLIVLLRWWVAFSLYLVPCFGSLIHVAFQKKKIETLKDVLDTIRSIKFSVTMRFYFFSLQFNFE